jgi:drug/metabolite transporter (DMT)-like permease
MSWFVLALLGSCFASLATILQKRTLQNIHSIDFAVALSCVAALITLPALFVYPWSSITPALLVVVVIVSCIASVAYFWMVRAVRHLPISVSSPLVLLSPIVATGLAYVLLAEHLTLIQLSGIGAMIVGLYVLETRHIRDWREFYQHLTANFFVRLVIAASVLYGISSLFDRVALGWWHVPAPLYIAIVQIGIAIWMLVIAWKAERRSPREVVGVFVSEWKLIVLVAVFTCAHRLLESQAMALAAVGLVTAVKRTSTLFTTVIGGELFHEDHLLRKGIACGIMIGGLYLLGMAA